jgi:hypothetical protein
MSTYGTEFEHNDNDGLYVNRCCNEHYPLMVFMAGGRYGVEFYRDDVERLISYLSGIVGTVPERITNINHEEFA